MLYEGEIVHYVLPDGPEHMHGQCRSAVVARHGEISETTADLLVFDDPRGKPLIVESDDGTTEILNGAGVRFRRDIAYAHPKEFGTWHHLVDCHEIVN